MAIICSARRSAVGEFRRFPVNSHSTTNPARASIRESIPNPMSAMDDAARPAASAIPYSMKCQPMPPQASHESGAATSPAQRIARASERELAGACSNRP